LEKERKEEARQRAGRLEIIRLKDKVDMVLAKGETPEAGKLNNTDLKVMIQRFKREGGKAMPNNKDGLLHRYRETCTRVVAPVTYRADEEDLAAGVDFAVTTGADIAATTVDVTVGAAIVAAITVDDGVGVVAPTPPLLLM
jgi:hypothetical protein